MQKRAQGIIPQKQYATRWYRRIAMHVALVLAGAWIGSLVGIPSMADAEVRKGNEPVAFKSGGERSEAVLRDIVVILNRMDGRMAKIEEILVQAANAHP
ncbi:MAG: hypothetical protein JW829_08530 [Pirellulales bacterium]|nr:hypothetical protein [Pirellulales bacterium]